MSDDDEVEQANTGAVNEDETQTSSQTLVEDIAIVALRAVLKFGVRTAILGSYSLVIARYRLTLFAALAYLAFVVYKVRSASAFMMGAGMIIMYQASSGSWSTIDADGTQGTHFLLYWLGESITIFMVTYNCMKSRPSLANPLYLGLIMIFGSLAALWFRGRFKNYLIVLGLEAFFAIFIAVSFPNI